MALIIAELCRNHQGERAVLQQMVWEAAAAGADYAKIQSMTPEELTFREEFEGGDRAYAAERAALQKTCLTDEDHHWFLEECAKAKIKPLTTVFSRERMAFLAGLPWANCQGRRELKVASADCASYPMLEELRAHFDHLYVSTGMTHDEELVRTAEVLRGHSYTLLHCVSIYPTPLPRMNLRRIHLLRGLAPSVGFSDHSAGATTDALKASICSLYLGVDVIERHFTVLDRSLTRDGAISLDSEQLGLLVQFARMPREELEDYVQRQIAEFPMMLGVERPGLSEEERRVRAYQRGRFASHRDGHVTYNWE